MRVKPDRFEAQGERTLVFGTDEAGRRVAFHLPAPDAAVMRAQMDLGLEVYADLPDGPPSGSFKKIGEVTEIRRSN